MIDEKIKEWELLKNIHNHPAYPIQQEYCDMALATLRELKEQLQPQQSMRWVKVSERLPEYPGSIEYHYRLDGRRVMGNFYNVSPTEINFYVSGNTHEDYYINESDFYRLEWLEELSEADKGEPK